MQVKIMSSDIGVQYSSITHFRGGNRSFGYEEYRNGANFEALARQMASSQAIAMSARAPVRLSRAQRSTPRIDGKLLHFIESVPDAMVLSDEKGRIVLLNTNAERMFGYSRRELVGEEIEVLVPERSRTVHREDRTTYYADPSSKRMGVGRELSARGKDGIEFPIEISLAPVRIRGKTFVWSAIRDISDRERHIAQLRGAMQKKRLALGGTISICAWCRQVHDAGGWLPLDQYVAAHSKATFTHGICSECLAKLRETPSTREETPATTPGLRRSARRA